LEFDRFPTPYERFVLALPKPTALLLISIYREPANFAKNVAFAASLPAPFPFVKDVQNMPHPSASSGKLQSYVVIPARYASTRLPQKMLLRETGKTLLEHTYQAARAAKRPAGVIVATDHPEIAREVERFGGQCVMTSPACQSGTDRVAEVARTLPRADIVVNVQGDEPEMAPANVDRVIELLEQDPLAPMATLAAPLPSPEQLTNPACVKVVFDHHGRALYFSRSPIPFLREPDPSRPFNQPTIYYQHLGIYAFRRETLPQIVALSPSSLEQAEKLEQLRMLQSGGTILVGVVEHVNSGIDTPADYAAFVARQKKAA
jgi:3-deoxy-manno-octulosonate cytidylyltransferase (CMP-KDO synthetase)